MYSSNPLIVVIVVRDFPVTLASGVKYVRLMESHARSITEKVMVALPMAVAVPEINPVALRVNPVGSVPLSTFQA